ncbi:MAG: hypothetical protein CMJ77_21960 [Planctomycetaceae bacterium]|nr:hypothetical protein [Planctomycetaceae bacterium]
MSKNAFPSTPYGGPKNSLRFLGFEQMLAFDRTRPETSRASRKRGFLTPKRQIPPRSLQQEALSAERISPRPERCGRCDAEMPRSLATKSAWFTPPNDQIGCKKKAG